MSRIKSLTLTGILVLMLTVVFTAIPGCKSTAEPEAVTPEPSAPAPEPSLEPEPVIPEEPASEPAPSPDVTEPPVEGPSTGEPESEEPAVTGFAALDLPDEPSAEMRLNVEKIYSGGDAPGLCYLGSYAMLAKYADNDIEFSDVIANCGIATSAFYVPEINLMLNGFEIGSIGVAAGNQGFDYYISALKGAQLTDEFLAMNLVYDAREIISTDSGEESFLLLKRLISGGIPVMAHLDIDYIREPLIEYCPYWASIFSWQDTHMSGVHIDHYMTVNGYDGEYVYLNDPTEKQEDLGTDIPVPTADFLASWENGAHPSFAEESLIGPYWMLFLGERGTAKSVAELLDWNREIAAEAIPAIRQAAENPNVSDLIHCNEMGRSRGEFAIFLKENGLAEAGEIFEEISALFKGLDMSPDQRADLQRIADLQEEALSKF